MAYKNWKDWDHSIIVADHNGTEYPSIKAMCAQWNIEPETYTRRRKVYGMTLKEALTTPVKPNGGKTCYDFNGERFRSRSEMCRKYGIDRKLFEYRIAHGMDLEEALTRPCRPQHKKN